MQKVSAESFIAQTGEKVFSFDFSPPDIDRAGNEGLAAHIDVYVDMYIRLLGLEGSRYTQLGSLSWSIICSQEQSQTLASALDDMGLELFQDNASKYLNIQIQDASSEIDDPSSQSDDWVMETPEANKDNEIYAQENPTESEIDDPSSQSDDWVMETREANKDNEIYTEENPTESDMDFPSDEMDASAEPAFEAQEIVEDVVSSDQVDGIDLEPIDDASIPPISDEISPEADEPLDLDINAPMTDDLNTVMEEPGLEVPDLGTLAPDLEAQTPDLDARTPDLDTVSADLDAMTEVPEHNSGDIAAQLADFRREIREIAASIPAQDTASFVEKIRSDMEELTGAIGQRIDGAAQRIESAAESIINATNPQTGDRLHSAAEKAERTASILESTANEAVSNLKALLEAANIKQLEPDEIDLDDPTVMLPATSDIETETVLEEPSADMITDPVVEDPVITDAISQPDDRQTDIDDLPSPDMETAVEVDAPIQSLKAETQEGSDEDAWQLS